MEEPGTQGEILIFLSVSHVVVPIPCSPSPLHLAAYPKLSLQSYLLQSLKMLKSAFIVYYKKHNVLCNALIMQLFCY